jgi:hypothetical protein
VPTKAVHFDEMFPPENPDEQIAPLGIPAVVYRILEKEAQKRGVSVAQIVADALDLYFKAQGGR